MTVLFAGGQTHEWDGPGGIRKAKCRATHDARTLRLRLVGGASQDTFNVDLSTGETQGGTLNNQGRATVVFTDLIEGPGQATVIFGCGSTNSAEYRCR